MARGWEPGLTTKGQRDVLCSNCGSGSAPGRSSDPRGLYNKELNMLLNVHFKIKNVELEKKTLTVSKLKQKEAVAHPHLGAWDRSDSMALACVSGTGPG